MYISVSATSIVVILVLTSGGSTATSAASRYRLHHRQQEQQQQHNDALQQYKQGCLSPRKPLHGAYRWKSDISVQYICRPGFVIVGDTYVSCQHGRWSSPPPLCLSTNCKQTPLKHGTTYLRHGGAMARVYCHNGYTLHGPQLLACDSGHWNGTQPECLPVRQGTSGRRQRHSQKATRFRDVIRPTSSGRIQRQQPGGANKLLQDDWLNEADYSCIQNRRTVPPPVVINARHTTSWAMYEGRPRLYTTYKCKWGYVARPPHTAGSLYCRHGVWVGRAPFCQRFVSDKEIRGNDNDVSPYQNHETLLRRADYSCSDVKPLSSSRADVKLMYDVVDAHPRLYAKYTCRDGFVLKDRSRQFVYCLKRKWIGVVPTCVIDRSEGCRMNNGGCAHQCFTKNGAVKCSCNSGYRLAEDQHACLDVDECEVNNAGCHHICENTPGSYRCDCYAGYQLSNDDQRTCYRTHSNHIQ